MSDVVVLVLAVALGFYLKGVSGMGEAIPLAAVGAWFVPVTDLVVIITVLDLAGSAAAMRGARLPLVMREDRRYAIWLVLGIACGVFVLMWGDDDLVTAIFMASLVVVALLMIRRALPASGTSTRATRGSSVARAAASLYAGFSGGLTGIDGPPLAAALYRSGGMRDIRYQLMRLLLISAAARAALLLFSGMVTWRLAGVAAALIPVAVASFLLSRRLHPAVPPWCIAGLCAFLCFGSVLLSVLR